MRWINTNIRCNTTQCIKQQINDIPLVHNIQSNPIRLQMSICTATQIQRYCISTGSNSMRTAKNCDSPPRSAKCSILFQQRVIEIDHEFSACNLRLFCLLFKFLTFLSDLFRFLSFNVLLITADRGKSGLRWLRLFAADFTAYNRLTLIVSILPL